MKPFKSLIYFIIVSFVSTFVVAGIYLGFRVYDASINNLLPMDGVKLKEDMYAVLNNPIFTNASVSFFCIFFYFVKRKTINECNKIVPKEKLLSFTSVRIIVFSIALGLLLRLAMGLLIFLFYDWNVLDFETVLYSETSSQSIILSTANIVVLGFLVPISEELMFRKILISDLTQIYDNKKSVVIAYLCFVLLHSGNNLFFAIIGGALLLYLYMKYGNILFCIIAHSAINIVGTLDVSNIDEPLLYIIGCFCVGVVAYYTYKEIITIKKRNLFRK